MAIKDLIPWSSGNRDVSGQRSNEIHPFLALHRDINRMFDDVFRGFEMAPFENLPGSGGLNWPSIDIEETETDLQVIAELPGLEQKDVNLEIANGVLVISGEKKSESEDKSRRFSERYYGRFERRIPLEDVEESKASASFKNGVLTVIIPKTHEAKEKVRRIPINGNS